ncbi:protein kinase C iota type-like [Ixodes scapularis]|uniref:protein kinase C iota type-like n=1 Tax=Ixodes scapularis TaxID=6945 RepID=UPI001A9FD81E|nr:protein kinase C iota type-like [Ixodes scapularis]
METSRRDTEGHATTLHKWDSGVVAESTPGMALDLPVVQVVPLAVKDDVEVGSTASRKVKPSMRKALLFKLLPRKSSAQRSQGESMTQSVFDKDDDRSRLSVKSKYSNWKSVSFLTQIIEMPRLESMRAWSFSRIVIIDILRTRTQDLVCSARHTFSGEWAILKIVWKKRLSGFIAKRRYILRERRHWEALSECQFIVGLKSFFATKQCYCFVAEYYEGCTLQSVIEEGALRDDVIVKIVSQLTYALKHIHDRDMMYRNLAPSNILIDMNGVARIFDMSFCSKGKTSTSRIGSIPYMAPEVLRMEVYDRTSDYWSLGILTYVLYVRHTPMSIYSAKTDLDHWVDKAYMYQYAEVIPIVLPKHMAPAAKSLIAGLLVERPRLRLGCRSTGFYEIMKHPYFKGVDWESFSKRKFATARNFPKGQHNL